MSEKVCLNTSKTLDVNKSITVSAETKSSMKILSQICLKKIWNNRWGSNKERKLWSLVMKSNPALVVRTQCVRSIVFIVSDKSFPVWTKAVEIPNRNLQKMPIKIAADPRGAVVGPYEELVAQYQTKPHQKNYCTHINKRTSIGVPGGPDSLVQACNYEIKIIS